MRRLKKGGFDLWLLRLLNVAHRRYGAFLPEIMNRVGV